MKKTSAKKLIVVALVAICFAQVATFSACQKKEATVLAEVYTYGTITSYVSENTKEEVEAYYRERGQDDFRFSAPILDWFWLTKARICSIEDAPSKVRFVTDEPDVVPKGYDGIVVTSKWMYFSAVLQTVGVNLIRENAEAEIAVYEDRYCMEQVALHPNLYRCSDPSHPDCKRVEIEAELESLALSRIDSYCNGYVAEPIFLHPREAVAAATYRYGLVDFSFDDARPATVYLWSTTGTYGLYPHAPTQDDVSSYLIVGYVETEADKLLSKGVSMDKNSREYKIVAEQLRHPVFYVSNNDQLQGVRYVETE